MFIMSESDITSYLIIILQTLKSAIFLCAVDGLFLSAVTHCCKYFSRRVGKLIWALFFS